MKSVKYGLLALFATFVAHDRYTSVEWIHKHKPDMTNLPPDMWKTIALMWTLTIAASYVAVFLCYRFFITLLSAGSSWRRRNRWIAFTSYLVVSTVATDQITPWVWEVFLWPISTVTMVAFFALLFAEMASNKNRKDEDDGDLQQGDSGGLVHAG